jgi:hypothetical protein
MTALANDFARLIGPLHVSNSKSFSVATRWPHATHEPGPRPAALLGREPSRENSMRQNFAARRVL